MPEPFDALRAPLSPVDPDPAFATALRGRIERALALPRGVTVSDLDRDAVRRDAGDRAVGVEEAQEPAGIVPYICVAGAAAAVDWYVEAFGARLVGTPIVMGDGSIGHAELAFGGRVLYLSDESPASHVAGPRPGADATVTLMLPAADVDLALRRATDAGAALERPAADHPYGRNGVVRDPFGHRWMITGPVTAQATAPGDALRHGDIAYVSLWVGDVDQAAAFFGHVLGWTYGPASGPLGRQVAGAAPHHGMWGGEDGPTLFLCFSVDDVDDAVERVRAAGGSAEEPAVAAYGRVAGCVDDQGTPFALVESPPGEPGRRGPENGAGHGDLAYVTMGVVDSAKARAFYGSVLGWRFRPGRVEDGWAVEDTWPMTGMAGGREQAVVVPMYRVDDIGRAVEVVRAGGGTSTDPEAQPYGITAQCVDDQGTRFSLGQL